MFLNTLIIVAATAALIMSYAMIVVLGVTPFWTPQYLIPILGMWASPPLPRPPHPPACAAGGNSDLAGTLWGGTARARARESGTAHGAGSATPWRALPRARPFPETPPRGRHRVLGNTITGISVGLGTIIDELSSGQGRPACAARARVRVRQLRRPLGHPARPAFSHGVPRGG